MIYLDNAATTKMSESTVRAMLPYLEDVYGNPSSLHSAGQKANEAPDGLPPHKLHCSVLAEEAIQKALQDYFDKNGMPYDKTDFSDCNDCRRLHDDT